MPGKTPENQAAALLLARGGGGPINHSGQQEAASVSASAASAAAKQQAGGAVPPVWTSGTAESLVQRQDHLSPLLPPVPAGSMPLFPQDGSKVISNDVSPSSHLVAAASDEFSFGDFDALDENNDDDDEEDED